MDHGKVFYGRYLNKIPAKDQSAHFVSATGQLLSKEQ